MLDTLLSTLITEMQNDAVEGRRSEASWAARRFVRSVIRIFTVISIELAPQSGRKKLYVPPRPRALGSEFSRPPVPQDSPALLPRRAAARSCTYPHVPPCPTGRIPPPSCAAERLQEAVRTPSYLP